MSFPILFPCFPPPAPPKPSPSLRGTPTPEELTAAWEISPRRLNERLRIGSRLADLEPTLDSSFVFKTNIAGSKRIIARAPGLKGWLASNTPDIAYSTATHYKKLATRLRQLIGLDARIPLEWLLPGSPDGRAQLSARSHSDQTIANAARRKLHGLLGGHTKDSRRAKPGPGDAETAVRHTHLAQRPLAGAAEPLPVATDGADDRSQPFSATGVGKVRFVAPFPSRAFFFPFPRLRG